MGTSRTQADVVGYRYQRHVWCPLDLVMHMAATGTLSVDIMSGETMEEVLAHQALVVGIDYEHPESYSPARFPQPILVGTADADSFCDACDRILSEPPQRFADNT